MARGTIYRTVFEVEVLSEGPFNPNGGDTDPFDLAAINYAITEGDCIGNCEQKSSDVVPDDEVVDALCAIGNTGSFFDLDGDEDD